MAICPREACRRWRPISAPLASSLLPVLLSAEFSALHAELIKLFPKLRLGLGGSVENPAGPVTLKPGRNLPAVGKVMEELLILAGAAPAAAAAAAVEARVRCGWCWSAGRGGGWSGNGGEGGKDRLRLMVVM